MVRANIDNQCPEDYKPCSKNTPSHDTICHYQGDESMCPINVITFAKEPSAKEGEDSVRINDDYFLITAKNGSGRALMQFFLGENPCIEPNEYVYPQSAKYYPLEEDKTPKRCTMNKSLNKTHDGRYESLGFTIDELQLQQDSGVWDKLQWLPLYDKYVPDAIDAKHNTNYTFYARQSIPWSLTCENQANNTRREILTALDNAGPAHNPAVRIIMIYGVLFFLIPLLTSCCTCYLGTRKNDDNRGPNTPLIMLCMTQVALLFFMATRFQMQVMNLESGANDVEDTLLTYARVNGCSDEYTRIDVEQEKLEFGQADDVIKTSVLPMLNELTCTVGGNFCFLLFTSLCIFYCNTQKNRNGHVRQRDES